MCVCLWLYNIGSCGSGWYICVWKKPPIRAVKIDTFSQNNRCLFYIIKNAWFQNFKWFHFYIQSFGMNMLQWNQGWVYVCVCMCVCVCLCVWQRYSPNGWMDFNEIFYKWSDRYLRGSIFLDFDISKSMTSWRPFCTFSLGHSHGRNFAPIFFKISE